METWNISALSIEAHKPRVLRSDEETRAIAIKLGQLSSIITQLTR